MRKMLFGFFLIFLIFMTGCNPRNIKTDIEEIADKLVEEIKLPSQTTENLEFRSSYVIDGIEVEVQWFPNDLAVITASGIITRGFDNKAVDIQITIWLNGEETTKSVGTVLVLGYSEEEIEAHLKTAIQFPETANMQLSFPETVNLYGNVITLNWESSNTDVIANDGKVTYRESLQTADITVTAAIGSSLYTIDWGTITVPPISEHINYVIAQLRVPETASSDIELPRKYDDLLIQWKSSNTAAMTDTGKWIFQDKNTDIIFTALFLCQNKVIEKKYPITVLTISNQERMNLVLNTVVLPEKTGKNLTLKTNFDYNVTGTWSSSNRTIISDDGLINLTSEEHSVILTLTLHSGEETMKKEFTVKTETISEGEVFFNGHMFLNYFYEIDTELLNNLQKENERIILNPSALEGYYESPIYRTFLFDRLVGSWAAISNIHATCELQIRVRVNGTWSSYMSYSRWGLGLQNALYDQNAGVARMADDEVLINNSQKAEAFQYRITLRRTSLTDTSPKLSLVGIALSIPDYTYQLDVKDLPDYVDYDVPKLYQHDVPGIGGSICSITSSTMLLMFKGHTFSNISLPHQETAPLFYDYGNRIHGNWVYNTVGMSAYGEKSYVKRIYSFDELRHHLATVGPVALSIKGDTGLYNTNGHLIVVRGYRITENETKILCNDPNVKGVYVEYSLAVFERVSRNVIYVVE